MAICARMQGRSAIIGAQAASAQRSHWRQIVRIKITHTQTETHSEQAMNKDQVKGRIKETEGKIKAAAGKLVGNKYLEAKGIMQQTEGEMQTKYGDLKSDLKRGG